MIHEEDGIIEDQVCKSALPLMFAKGGGTWCSKSAKVCVKTLGEKCRDEDIAEVAPIV